MTSHHSLSAQKACRTQACMLLLEMLHTVRHSAVQVHPAHASTSPCVPPAAAHHYGIAHTAKDLQVTAVCRLLTKTYTSCSSPPRQQHALLLPNQLQHALAAKQFAMQALPEQPWCLALLLLLLHKLCTEALGPSCSCGATAQCTYPLLPAVAECCYGSASSAPPAAEHSHQHHHCWQAPLQRHMSTLATSSCSTLILPLLLRPPCRRTQQPAPGACRLAPAAALQAVSPCCCHSATASAWR